MHRLAAALLLTAAASTVQAQSVLPTRPADPDRPAVSATGHTQPVPIAAPRGGPGPVTTAFTYQGRLEDNGNPANAQYDLRFTLLDDLGATVAGPICIDNVLVTDGVFSVQLDFGPVMTGDARQLRIAVRPGGPVGNCAAGPAYTTLTPDQPLTATPYALGLRLPFQGVRDLPQQHLFTVQNTGMGPFESGVRGIHVAPGSFPYDDSAGLRGESNADFGTGVLGISDRSVGVIGYTAGGLGRYGVFGRSDGEGGIGVAGYMPAGQGYAVFGLAPDVTSWAGYFSGRVTVDGNFDAVGSVRAGRLQVTDNAGVGRTLVSDANGNATWTQTNSVSISGPSPGVGTASGFVSPVAAITVGAGQKIHVTAHQSLGSVASGGAGNLNIFIGVRAQGSDVITTIGGGMFGLTVGQNQRSVFGISGIVSGLAPGVYEVGMVGSSSSAPSWNNNEWGYVTAFTLN